MVGQFVRLILRWRWFLREDRLGTLSRGKFRDYSKARSRGEVVLKPVLEGFSGFVQERVLEGFLSGALSRGNLRLHSEAKSRGKVVQELVLEGIIEFDQGLGLDGFPSGAFENELLSVC